MRSISDRFNKPWPWNWGPGKGAPGCRWATRGLVVAWPIWEDFNLSQEDPWGPQNALDTTKKPVLNGLIERRHAWWIKADNVHRAGAGISSACGKRGRSLRCTALQVEGERLVTATDAAFPTTAATIVLHYRKTDTTNRDSQAINTSPQVGGRLCRIHLPYTDGKGYWGWGGATEGTSRLSVASLSFGDDGWVFSVGPRGMEIWQNGKKVASNTGTPTRTNLATDTWGLWGTDPTITFVANDLAEVGIVLLYNDQKSEAENAALSRDPYLAIRPARRAIVKSAGLLALLGTAEETEEAEPLTPTHEATLGVANEIEEAEPLLITHTYNLGTALETDEAMPLDAAVWRGGLPPIFEGQIYPRPDV